MDRSLFKHYEALQRKIDRYCDQARQKFGPRLQCRAGCALCCAQDIAVLPVEFHFLRAHPAITEATKQLGTRTSQGCVFLHEDRCTIYQARPVICRTHGLPLLVRSGGTQQRDCCPLNTRSLVLESLERSDLLDLETLNTMLGAVNLLFCRQTGREREQKHRLSSLLTIQG